MIPIDLSGKQILLTGALGAIAEHVVKRLTDAGATVLATDIVPEAQAAATLRDWGVPAERVDYRRMDVTLPKEVEAGVTDFFDRFPGCDLVLGHAGGCELHSFDSTPAEIFERIMRFNFLAQTHLARSILKEWSRRGTAGHLIFTSSYVAQVPHVGIPAYAPAKAALECFAKCLALENAARRIRVNCISPGNVATGSSLKVYDADPNYRAFVDRVTPCGRRNTPEAVADAFLFLCSPLAAEWNGQTLHVDYGITIPKVG